MYTAYTYKYIWFWPTLYIRYIRIYGVYKVIYGIYTVYGIPIYDLGQP